MKNQTLDGAQSSPKRLVIWIIGSFVIHFLCLGGFAGGICGCHFHPIALAFGAPPVIWAVYISAAEKSKGERALAILNLVAVDGWIFIEWSSNLQFAFRS